MCARLRIKLAILGSRGVPNRYGGFERFAERLALGLNNKGYEVHVFCPHYQEYRKSYWEGVRLDFVYNPEGKVGPIGNMVYDFNSLTKSLLHGYDIIYVLGYTSSAPFLWMLRLLGTRSRGVLITNMDGIEWKRAKWGKVAQKYLFLAEKMAVMWSDYVLADSRVIRDYLCSKYNISPIFIPYGADVFTEPDPNVLEVFGLKPYEYCLLVARIEPENNIEIIIKGYIASRAEAPLVIVGPCNNKYSRTLMSKYNSNQNVVFLGGIYDLSFLNNLRYYSKIYFHGHSVGGTNPSLLEAMGCRCYVVAHDNPFNREVLEETGVFFKRAEDIVDVVHYTLSTSLEMEKLRSRALERVRENYSWGKIVDSYFSFFAQVL